MGFGIGAHRRNEYNPLHTSGCGLLEQTNRALHIHPFNAARSNLLEVPGGVNKRGHQMLAKLFCYRMLTIQGPWNIARNLRRTARESHDSPAIGLKCVPDPRSYVSVCSSQSTDPSHLP